MCATQSVYLDEWQQKHNFASMAPLSPYIIAHLYGFLIDSELQQEKSSVVSFYHDEWVHQGRHYRVQ